ncbi:TetR/AcrR family transcriptional regulator [Actinocorallia populi]|uniref:TetR/AcrR family transcriptional regulator n=1 Tax=Actinocorallia populi TaxID=2079200 RepID=UPI000D090F63|nr:TetR/AcrR family transcriptional regulator [Actinocorallia populi]
MGVARSGEATTGREPGARRGRRDQLLEVAAGLFATKGYAETTMRDIADATGILAGSIYHHFSSKEAMLDEFLRGFLVDLHERFSAAERKNADPQETLSELIRISFSCIHDSPHAVAVYQNESANLKRQEAFAYVGDYGARSEQIWLRVLTAGQEAGVVRPDLDVKVAYLFIRDAVWSAVHWYRPGGQLSLETVADQYLDLLYGGLF